MFLPRDVRKADEAASLQRRINFPAKEKYVRIVKENYIRNNPLTVGDVKRSIKFMDLQYHH